MVNDIDLAEINQQAPYKISQNSEFKYIFDTDFGVSYRIEFEFESLLLPYESYQLSIVNSNNRKSPRDPKLRDTIIAIIHGFLKANNTAMLYICDTGDSKHRVCVAGSFLIGLKHQREAKIFLQQMLPL